MAIKVLPQQLANQIAAGEVVERPAAVVKELLENSIDAGATQVTVDIEAGGLQLIRLRDNGAGIPQAELELALARHATSKISSLEALQAVTSLGFRGEALASISAVCRLTLVSRTADQAQAWQLYREGGVGSTPLKPAAHPQGSTFEVCDLFYNTPARRKFLRSAKSEFSHIDEIVRRIALSQWPLALILTHNGKRIRDYRPALAAHQLQARLAATCGSAFAEQALYCSHQDAFVTLQGWVAPATATHLQNDRQYCAINGRIVRDRIVSHAVRQAYHDRLTPQQQPAFVLFLTLDPQQVDVNVHPTKQAVRFQQARCVHGAIYQAVAAALQTVNGEKLLSKPRGRAPSECSIQAPPLARQPLRPRPLQSVVAVARPAAGLAGARPLLGEASATPLPTEAVSNAPPSMLFATDAAAAPAIALSSLGRVLTIWQQQYALLEQQGALSLISLPLLQRDWQQRQLLPVAPAVISQQILIIPICIALSTAQIITLQAYQPLLAQLALDLQLEAPILTVLAVPTLLAAQDLPTLCLKLLDYLALQPQAEIARVVGWLVQQLTPLESRWQLAQAIQLLAAVEREAPRSFTTDAVAWQQPLDLTPITARFVME